MAILSMLGLYELIKVRETKKRYPVFLKIFAYIMVFAANTAEARRGPGPRMWWTRSTQGISGS